MADKNTAPDLDAFLADDGAKAPAAAPDLDAFLADDQKAPAEEEAASLPLEYQSKLPDPKDQGPVDAGIRAAAKEATLSTAPKLKAAGMTVRDYLQAKLGKRGDIDLLKSTDADGNPKNVSVGDVYQTNVDAINKSDDMAKMQHPGADAVGSLTGGVMGLSALGTASKGIRALKPVAEALTPTGGSLLEGHTYRDAGLKLGRLGFLNSLLGDRGDDNGAALKNAALAGVEAAGTAPAVVIGGKVVEKPLEWLARKGAGLMGRGADVADPYLADRAKYNNPDLSLEKVAEPVRDHFKNIESQLGDAAEQQPALIKSAAEAEAGLKEPLKKAELDGAVTDQFKSALNEKVDPVEADYGAAKDDVSAAKKAQREAELAHLRQLKETPLGDDVVGATRDAVKGARESERGMAKRQVEMLQGAADTTNDIGGMIGDAEAQLKELRHSGATTEASPDYRAVKTAVDTIKAVRDNKVARLMEERFPGTQWDELPTSEQNAIQQEASKATPEDMLDLRQKLDGLLSAKYKRELGGYSPKAERTISQYRNGINEWFDSQLPNSAEYKAARAEHADATNTATAASKTFGRKQGLPKLLERLVNNPDPEAMALLKTIDKDGSIQARLDEVRAARARGSDPTLRDQTLAEANLPEASFTKDAEGKLSAAEAARKEVAPYDKLRSGNLQRRLEGLNSTAAQDDAARLFDLAGQKAEAARGVGDMENPGVDQSGMGQTWENLQQYLENKNLLGDKSRLDKMVGELPEVQAANAGEQRIADLKQQKKDMGGFNATSAENTLRRLMRSKKPGAQPETALAEQADAVGKGTGQDLNQLASDLRVREALTGDTKANGSRGVQLGRTIGRNVGHMIPIPGASYAGEALGAFAGGSMDFKQGAAAKFALDQFLNVKPVIGAGAASAGLQAAAVLRDKIAKLGDSPEGSQYAAVLDKAAERGPEAVMATHAALMKDPTYAGLIQGK